MKVRAVLPVQHYLPDPGVLVFLAAMNSTFNESACRAACPALPAGSWCVDFIGAMNSTFNESVCAVLPVQHYLPEIPCTRTILKLQIHLLLPPA